MAELESPHRSYDLKAGEITVETVSQKASVPGLKYVI